MLVSGGFESLGLEYISALLEAKGFQTELAFDPQLFNDPFIRIRALSSLFNYQNQLLRKIRDFNPSLIGFSVISADYHWAINFARKIKTFSSAHITFGGIHPTSVPELVIQQDCVDSVVVGEGEYPFLDLAESIRSGQIDFTISNVWFKHGVETIRNPVRPLIQDLDALPFPNKDLYYKTIPSYRHGYTLITRRGCINSCSFCHNSLLDKIYSGQPKGIRLRSVENVLDELIFAKKKYNFKLLRINDEIFTYNKEWLRAFSERYSREINVPLYCFATSGTIDAEVIQYLKTAKCYQICMGVQSPNMQIRKTVFNRHESNKSIIKAIKLCREYNIRLVVDNIIGFPHETENDLLEMVKFYNQHRPHRICVFWLVYYPRTVITERAEREGILSKTDINQIENDPCDTANTLYNKAHLKIKKRYHLFIILYHILPPSLFSWMLNKQLYRYLPMINPALIEYPYTIFARDRLDIPRRRYYVRYLKYIFRILSGKNE